MPRDSLNICLRYVQKMLEKVMHGAEPAQTEDESNDLQGVYDAKHNQRQDRQSRESGMADRAYEESMVSGDIRMQMRRNSTPMIDSPRHTAFDDHLPQLAIMAYARVINAAEEECREPYHKGDGKQVQRARENDADQPFAGVVRIELGRASGTMT